jgi:DNA modification methylase
MQEKLIKENQIWKLGSHRLLVGSATDEFMISKLLEGVKIDTVLTDAPYGVDYVQSKLDFVKLACDRDIINDDIMDSDKYAEFMSAWMKLIILHLSPYNCFYLFNSDKMLFSLKKAMDDCDVRFTQLLIWVKSHAVIGRLNYLPQHELIIYGWYKKHKFRKSQDKSVLFYPKPSKSKLHSTMKPIELITNLVLNSTEIGGVVYDCFLGSGTTLIACEMTRRICYGAELDLVHAKTIIDRWEKFTKQTAELIYEKS